MAIIEQTIHSFYDLMSFEPRQVIAREHTSIYSCYLGMFYAQKS